LSQAGYFTTNVGDHHTLRTLAHPTDDSVSLEYRVRSYLAVNCVQCHQPAGTTPTLWDARITTSTANAGLVNGALINHGEDTNNRVLVPGNLSNSMLLTRIAMRGPGQMPPLTTTLVDTQAVALISAWITNDLPSFQTFADWQLSWFGSTNTPEAALLADPDGDGANNKLESLTGTNPTNALDAWQISFVISNAVPLLQFPQVANRGFEVQTVPDLTGSAWTPLNVPANAPSFSATNRNALITDPAAPGDSGYYRVRIYEP
jgi:mono/diheme cytochrome c family protein